MRTLIKRDFDTAWSDVDVVLTPTTPSPAFGFGEKSGDPIAMYLEDIFTVTVNMAGLPGISVPAGLSAEGTPMGLQLIGKPFDEGTLFRAGQVIEDAAGRFPVPTAGGRESSTTRTCGSSSQKSRSRITPGAYLPGAVSSGNAAARHILGRDHAHAQRADIGAAGHSRFVGDPGPRIDRIARKCWRDMPPAVDRRDVERVG